MNRLLNVINILLAVAVLAIAAGITANGLSLRMVRALQPTAAPAVPARSAASRPTDLAQYAPIMVSGLFGKGAQGELTPVVKSVAVSATSPATAPAELLLLGTAVGSFRETFALVRHTARQEERVFRLGDSVFEAGRLVEVGKEKAFILINNRKLELFTPQNPPSASPAPAQGTGRAAGVANVGGGNYVIDQRTLNAALDNIGQAMTDARLLPSQKDGRVEGFRASEVKPGGVFAMIGIRNGDVLLRLNDFPIDSPDKALQSFVALKGQSRLKLDIIRDGQPATFNYDIR